ncbi:Intradiol ring-cleavage dioxygenase [Coniella lustricola]|uniref:Intradiol ring-cleavage dioxygenase n=1 Tax=Coniella lustricola TaxID=2025994 RepID=A0A2T3AB51_9PEZI|nr:Intradiol ring-cleavage dioxygenase [Coniella lustricola]
MIFTQTILLGLAALAAAHPGHEEEEHRRAVESRDVHHANKRALENCAAKLEARGHTARAIERRKNTLEAHRDHFIAPIVKRNTTTVLDTDHEGSLNATTAASDETYVFADDTCTVLNPEGEVGPFYVLGEYVRSDVTDGEPGVPIVSNYQFIDVNTCEPLAGVWADVWNANATGVYAGVQTDQNGNGDDASNLNATFCRGIQQADEDGVVQFSTIFPGHYSGRTNHIHIVLHENATELANGTISGGSVSHIGQFFWDQSLIDLVEATSPYNTNTNPVTTNAEDRVFGEQETEDSTSDPVFNYVYFSEDDLSEGLFTWILVGINTTASYTPTYSFELTSGGGVAVDGGNPGIGGGAGAGGGFGGGGFTLPTALPTALPTGIL